MSKAYSFVRDLLMQAKQLYVKTRDKRAIRRQVREQYRWIDATWGSRQYVKCIEQKVQERPPLSRLE